MAMGIICADAAFENFKAGNFEDIELVDTELIKSIKNDKLVAKDEDFYWVYMSVPIYPRPFAKTKIELMQ
jgi:hypothetical protein